MNVITVTNAVGNVANRVLVKAGHEQGKWHFYCGKKRDSKCLRGVCDPKCGPKDGCNCNACALLDNTVPLPYMDPSSISNEKVNRKGHKAKKVLVTSGHEKDKYHYYCGHKRDTVCSYDRCNDICGPSSGCNCHSCAELDRYDGLPPISLAPVASSSSSNSNSNKVLCNRNGHPVTLVAVSSGHEAGKQHHYCGKKRDTACPGGGCNNICGPKNGCNCSACKELDYRVFSQPVSNPPVVFSHAPPVVQYQAPQVQYTAPPSQLQYQGPPSQYQNQLPPQYYPALPPQPPQQSQPYPPQQYQVPPQYQVPQQYQSYPQPSAPPQGPPSYATQAPPTYTPTPYTPQGPPQGQAISNNNNSTTATSSPKSSTTSTAGAAAATAAAVVSTGFKLLKPVVKATASAATSLVKSAAHHIVDNDKDNSCVICMEKPKNASLVHGQTAHQCCCLECGELLKKSGQSCPICRAPIAAVIRNYSS